MKLIKIVHGWIKKDSPFEDDSNSLLFLIRFLLFIWAPYDIVILLYTLSRGLYKYSLVVSIAIVVYVLTLHLTYRTRVSYCAIAACLATMFSTFILTTAFGWRCSFQNMIYIIFLILWYDAMTDIKIKLLLSLIITSAICILSALTPFGGTILSPDSVEYKALVYFNIVVFSMCLSLVAYFYCTLYVDVEKSLRINNKKLKMLSETDTLTQLVNRRYAENELALLTTRNDWSSISIAIGDIDLFKSVNDTYGHECGDYVLSTIAAIFKETMRKHGFVARWGGEEFLFVYEKLNGDEALIELEKLRNKIEKTTLEYKDTKFNVTMTFGLEEYSSYIGVKETIDKADEKLYLGKQAGRNRIIY